MLTACGGGGGGGGGSSGAATVAPRYAFAVNVSDNSVATYAVDAASGRLKYIDKYFTENLPGANPFAVAVEPSGKYAYVANFGTNDVAAFGIHHLPVEIPHIRHTAALQGQEREQQ